MTLDLSPAKWIWWPSQRTLANTFVLFRREIDLTDIPESAEGWITADSRYRLTVNGQRVQWGPAPFDPRHAEADPIDLKPFLVRGKNVIGVEVLFYGHGEGTWPFGKPGLLAQVSIDGNLICTDSSWKCEVDRAHRPGQYRRWFLRALQEDFDHRLHPVGWDCPDFDDTSWLPAQELTTPASRSAFSGGYGEYANEIWHTKPSESTLIARTIPLLKEFEVDAELTHTHNLAWARDPRDWFEFRTPASFRIEGRPTTSRVDAQEPSQGCAFTYRLPEGVVGFPFFEVEAPEGTVIELMPQEAHDPEQCAWLDSHYYCWSRFVCAEGFNRFETFDYEALRWLQLHVHGNRGLVKIHRVGVRRRVYPFAQPAKIQAKDPALQRLFEASLNTLLNSAQETCVDGMGRERQQYSGDGGHQLHAIRMTFGEYRLPARFLRTFGQGQFLDGVFADSWPAYDRLARLWERNIDGSGWGPLVDHSIGFCFDHYWHWMQSGDIEPARSNWAKLMKFVKALRAMTLEDGLLPVENLGMNAVWIDHEAFGQQRHKRLALNLYASAALQHALAPLADQIAPDQAARLRGFGSELQQSAFKAYWDPDRSLLINNLPFGEADATTDDRSLATALIYGMLPNTSQATRLLAEPTDLLGVSYPANAVWRYWALIRAGQIQPVLSDLRSRWATMWSVTNNNTLQEFWKLKPDTTQIASHCPLAPLIALFDGIAGIQALSPSFQDVELNPQLGDCGPIAATAHTPSGPIEFESDGKLARYKLPEGVHSVRVRGVVQSGPIREVVVPLESAC